MLQSPLFFPRGNSGARSLPGGGDLIDDCMLVQHTFVLSGTQASRVCLVPSLLWDKQGTRWSLGKGIAPGKDGMLNIWPNSSFLRRSWDLGFFRNFLCAEPRRGVMVKACLLVQTIIFVFSGSQASRVNWVLAIIWNRQSRSRSFEQILEKKVLMPTLIFFSPWWNRDLKLIIHSFYTELWEGPMVSG